MRRAARWLVSTRGRQWAYGVFVAAVALLVGYGAIRDGMSPLWLTLGAAVFGTGVGGAAAVQRRRRRRVK